MQKKTKWAGITGPVAAVIATAGRMGSEPVNPAVFRTSGGR